MVPVTALERATTASPKDLSLRMGGPARAFIARCAGSGEMALEASKILGV